MLRPAHLFESTTPGRGMPLAPEDRDRIEHELVDLFDRSHRQFADRPLLAALHEQTAQFVLRGGKRLRPRLCLASYRILSDAGGSMPRPIVRAAAGLEIFHAFMLVHDDLIDRSLLRRDHPTLHEAIRLAPDLDVEAEAAGHLGLLGGDLLCALGMRMLARAGLDDAIAVRAQRLVADMLIDTGLGEALDVLYEARDLARLDEAEITEAYIRKTSRYSVSGPLVLGAILAGVPPRSCRALAAFGDQLAL